MKTYHKMKTKYGEQLGLFSPFAVVLLAFAFMFVLANRDLLYAAACSACGSDGKKTVSPPSADMVSTRRRVQRRRGSGVGCSPLSSAIP